MNVNGICIGRRISGVTSPKKWLSIWATMLAMMVTLTITMTAQATQPKSRITREISNANRVTLQGTVSRGMTAAPDMGAVEDAKSVRLYMILQRTPEQQAELDNLLARQQQPTAAEYHKWLTPKEMGERFGASQEDIAAITNWLQGQGIRVNGVMNNATFIDFTASAQQLRETFGANLHYFNIGGRKYYANTAEITIPSALQGVVRSVHGLNKIPHHANHTTPQRMSYDATTHTWKNLGGATSAVAAKPAYLNPNYTSEYDVTPQDYYTIYNVNSVFSGGNLGGNATIAVIEESDIEYGTVDGTGKATGGDVATFRTLFGVPGTLNMYVYHGYGADTCTAPGIDPNDEGEEIEAALDAEWATALAPAAKLIFMSCDNETDNGIFTSMPAVIDNNLADVMSLSYGASEVWFASTDYAFYDGMYAQAALQGQSIIISAGDSGSDVADQNVLPGDSEYCSTSDTATPDPSGTAVCGFNVNGFASSPNITVAGGTDFSDTYDNWEFGLPLTPYWGATNSANYSNALGYVPETTWNDSCASSILTAYEGYTGAGFCGSNPPFSLEGSAASGSSLVGGSGGFSTHYTVPAYQKGITGYSGTMRAQPDISMFASNGWWNHALIYCDSYRTSKTCTDTTGTATPATFGGGGGTSFVAPALAGIGGLLVSADGRQGLLNPALYALAKAQFTASATKTACYSNGQTSNTGATTKLPGAACTFNDVTTGNNSMPCASGSTNCYVNSGATYGVLSTSKTSLAVAYPSTAGYDEATGIGTLNVANLLTNWHTAFTSTTTMTASPTTIAYSGSTTLTAATSGNPPTGSTYTPKVTGTVSFNAGSTALGNCTLTGGSCSITVAGSALAIGSNSVSATFAGSSAYPASTSSITSVTVTQTATTTAVVASVNPVVIDNTTTLTATLTPGGTGTVTFASGTKTLGTATVSSGKAVATVTASVANGLGAGTDAITATYSGDTDYATSVGTVNLTVSQGSSSTTVQAVTATMGAPTTLTAKVAPTAATGTVTFKLGSTTLGTGTISGGTATLSITPTTAGGFSAGANTITANYGGDANYTASSGTGTLTAVASTTTTVTASPTPVTLGNSTTLTANVTPTAATGTVTFKLGSTTLGTGTISGGTATLLITPTTGGGFIAGANTITAVYGGDANYMTSSGTGTLTVVVPTTTVVTASPASVALGGSTTLTATITPAGTGTVTFTAGSKTLGTGTVTSGTATLAVSATAANNLGVGTDAITASYGGDAGHLTSSGTVNLPVSQATTTTTVQAVTATLGVSATLTAKVAPAAATGTVTFKLGSTTLGTGTLSSGTATLAITPTTAGGFSMGANTITASYGGDANYTASTGTGTLTVALPTYTLTPAASSTTITAGSSGNVTLNLTSTGYAGTVTMAATTNSASVTASATAVTLTSNGTGTTTVTISPSASAANHAPAVPWKSGGMVVFAVLLGAPFTLRRKRAMAVLLTALTLSTLGFMVACGGGGGGTPVKQARTYTVTVTPTGSGTVTDASAVTITVTVP
jgi:subtilase family serine protease